jgi:hypothetical protein
LRVVRLCGAAIRKPGHVNLEDEETVRAAAYGYHPESGGWQDEKDR